MKLLMKFNLISISLVAIALGIVSWVARSFLLDNARAEVLQQAKLMMESATSTRDYTTEELKPSSLPLLSTIASSYPRLSPPTEPKAPLLACARSSPTTCTKTRP
jgi:protein-histidine pros-kinase